MVPEGHDYSERLSDQGLDGTGRVGSMRRGLLGVLFLLVVAAAVVVLRQGLPSPAPKPQDQATVGPQPEPVERTGVANLGWRSVALPSDTEQPHRSSVDLEHMVFPVRGADGVRRVVSQPTSAATAATEIDRGNGGPDPLNATLDGEHLVVSEVSTGRTRLSTVDLTTGAHTISAEDFPAETVAVAAGSVAIQESTECLTVLDTATLKKRARHCTAPGWSISLLTAETDAVEWRETTSGDHCAVWFRLAPDGTPQQLPTGPRACRAASLIRAAGWEMTAEFPQYEVGVLIPGPLIARNGDRELALDTLVVDVHSCGGHVYWLSKPGNADQRGELARWTPGDNRVEMLSVGSTGNASTPRCVNGVLNVVTYGVGPPQLWILPNP
jgi:hypothetical protein